MKVYNIGHLAKAFELKLQIERDNISIYFKEFRDQYIQWNIFEWNTFIRSYRH